jgi:hypothetical protein
MLFFYALAHITAFTALDNFKLYYNIYNACYSSIFFGAATSHLTSHGAQSKFAFCILSHGICEYKKVKSFTFCSQSLNVLSWNLPGGTEVNH